jgi:hypothetical protein
MGLADLDGRHKCLLLFEAGIEPSGNVARWDQEQMAGADGEPVPECQNFCIANRMAKDDPLQVNLAKRAEHGGRRRE